MATALFSNETEKAYFYKHLAKRKLKDLRKERKGYEKEIEKALDFCGKILKDYGARCNFIEEIYKIEEAVEPKEILSSSMSREENVNANQIASLTIELTDLLKKIPREISEDLEFFSKQVIDRRARKGDTLEKEAELMELYPDADIIDSKQVLIHLKHIFDSIGFFTGEKQELFLEAEKNVVDITDIKDNRQKVVGIKKVPRSLLENAGLADQKDYSEELAKPITKTNSGLFGIVDDIFSEVNSQPQKSIPISVTETIKPEEVDVLKPVTISTISEDISIEEPEKVRREAPVIEPISIISEADLNKPIEETKDEGLTAEVSNVSEPDQDQTIKIETPKEEQNTVNEIDENSITFEMPEEFTLVDLAMALCEDQNGWMDIYKANKDFFDKVIQEKNNGNSDGIEYNKELFAGLTIKVPTVFNKGNEAKKALSKAA